MDSGVYQILNTANSHRYIGSAVNLQKRRWEHWRVLRPGTHHNRYVQRAFNKYGEAMFEFLVMFYCDPDNLILFEQRAMDYLHPEYNIVPTAGSQLGLQHTPETRAKISEAKRGNQNHLGHRHTPEARAKMSAKISAALKGRKRGPFSAEHRARLSAAITGKKYGPPSDATRAKISVALLGRKHTLQARAKMSVAANGRKISPETRAKISATLKDKKYGPSLAIASLGAHRRWHTMRGILNPECEFCLGGGPPEAYGDN